MRASSRVVLLVALLALALFALPVHADNDTASASATVDVLNATPIPTVAPTPAGPLVLEILSPASFGTFRYGSEVPLRVLVRNTDGQDVNDAVVSAGLDGRSTVLTFDPVGGGYFASLAPPASFGTRTIVVTASNGVSQGAATVLFSVVGASVSLVEATAVDLKTVRLRLSVRDPSGRSLAGLSSDAFNVTANNQDGPLAMTYDPARGEYVLTLRVTSTFAPVDVLIAAAGLSATLAARVPPYVVVSFYPGNLTVGQTYDGQLRAQTVSGAGVPGARVVVSFVKSDGVSRLNAAEGVTDSSGAFPFTVSSPTESGDSLSAVVYDPSGDQSSVQLVGMTAEYVDLAAAGCAGGVCLPDVSFVFPVLVNVIYLLAALALVLVAAGGLVFVVTRAWRAIHHFKLGTDKKAKEEAQIAQLAAAQEAPVDLEVLRSRRNVRVDHLPAVPGAPRRMQSGWG